MLNTFRAASNRQPGRIVTLCYLAALYAALVLAGLHMVKVPGQYGLPEWLINYAGGFLRRGLTGSVLLPLSAVLHLPTTLLPALLGIACYAALFVCAYLLLRASRWRWWAYALAVCPGTFAFPVISRTSFRKDVLFFAVLSALILWLRKPGEKKPLHVAMIAAPVLPLLVLCQEPLFVYFPYLVAALFVAFQAWRPVVRIAGPALVLAAVALVAVSVRQGTPAQVQPVCAAAGYPVLDGCPSGIRIAGAPPLDVAYTVRTYHYLRHYPLEVLLCLIPLAASFRSLWLKPSQRRTLLVVAGCAMLSVIGSIQLFRLGVDWGRWINLHLISLALLLLWIDDTVAVEAVRDAEPERAVRPFRRLAAAAALLVYATCWSVPGNLARPLYGYISLVNKVVHFHGSLSD